MQQVDTIKPRFRIQPVIWLPSLAVILLAMDCHQCEESFWNFLLGTFILLVTFVVVLLFRRSLRFKKVGIPSEVADSTSYVVVVIGGIWALLRLLNVGLVGHSIACLDGFVLGGLIGSLLFRQKRKETSHDKNKGNDVTSQR